MSNDVNYEELLNVQAVAVLIESSVPTISSWYRWKRAYPNNEYAQMLPDFERHGAHRARYWKYSDIPKLLAFKEAIPQGRNGVMGSITQAYARKSKWNKSSKDD